MIGYHYLNPATDKHLKKNRKRSGIISFLLSIPAILLLCLGLYLIKIFIFPSDVPVIITYQSPTVEKTEILTPKIKLGIRRPIAPASSIARAMANRSRAPLAISTPPPVPDFEEINYDFSPVIEFRKEERAMKWKEPASFTESKPDTGSFGDLDPLFGGLKGRLYDFKQNRHHQHNEEYLRSNPDARLGLYADYLNRIHRDGFSQSAFEPYFQAPQELSLTHLAISLRPAKEGPRYFGAEKDMQPQVWMAHYDGVVTVPKTGSYRFAGVADDYLALFIDGRPQLIACWPNLQSLVEKRWHQGKDSDRWSTPINDLNLIFGRWIKLEKGQHLKIDLGIGERPGGELGFLLLVEKKGDHYEKSPDGRPILPLFTTHPFTREQELTIKTNFPGFSFDWEKVPIFRTE